MLRQAIFVLMLVGAAFAGGAAINGPGLAWLQRNLIGGPTIIVDGSTPVGDPGRAGKRFPTASTPSLPFPATADSPSAPVADTRPSLPEPTSPPDSSAAGLLGLPGPAGPDPVALAAAALAPTAQDPASVAPGDLPALDLPLESPAAPGPAPKSDPTTRLASTGGLEPAPATSPSTSSAALAPLAPGRDWAEIRQRLKGLGVTRYTVDADLESRVRFSCVIPVEGLRAVGHHFEAEGDDIFQAVDATIRRITLWRATEPTRTDP